MSVLRVTSTSESLSFKTLLTAYFHSPVSWVFDRGVKQRWGEFRTDEQPEEVAACLMGTSRGA